MPKLSASVHATLGPHRESWGDGRRQLLRAFREHTLVLLLAEEDLARPGVQRFRDEARRRMGDRFAAVPLPARLPCGPERRAFLRQYVKERAGEQGVRVRYTKRE